MSLGGPVDEITNQPIMFTTTVIIDAAANILRHRPKKVGTIGSVMNVTSQRNGRMLHNGQYCNFKKRGRTQTPITQWVEKYSRSD